MAMANTVNTTSQESERLESLKLSSTSLYYSARIDSMIKSRSKFGTGVEFDVEFSKVHWTEQDWSDCHEEFPGESDREYFEMLKKPFETSPYYSFFREFDNLVIGEKIAEGAQGEVYEATIVNEGRPNDKSVVKIFKTGISLQYIHSQWSHDMFSLIWFGGYNPEIVEETLLTPSDWIQGGTLLKDEKFKNRFALVMWRQWGDLRRLIDERMVLKNHSGPPFNYDQVIRLMWCIAQDMDKLHEAMDIIHKDLKASNVLIRPWNDNIDIHGDYQFSAIIANFECSMGVIGTGFWRPPEILLQLKNGISSSNIKFTAKGDVYTYGMTCYEIVTGCIPFENYSFNDYEVVLSGQRPILPSDVNPLVEEIITSCWHPNPLQRPTFCDILEEIMPEYSLTMYI